MILIVDRYPEDFLLSSKQISGKFPLVNPFSGCLCRRFPFANSLDHMSTSTPSNRDPKKLSVAKAIAVGLVFVTGGVIAVIGLTVIVCQVFHFLSLRGSLFLGAVLAWPWWSVTVPRWRHWALSRGVDAKQLQKAGVRAGLVWPRGWIFEKTEIPPRKWEND
jgi:hypothetical protein